MAIEWSTVGQKWGGRGHFHVEQLFLVLPSEKGQFFFSFYHTSTMAY